MKRYDIYKWRWRDSGPSLLSVGFPARSGRGAISRLVGGGGGRVTIPAIRGRIETVAYRAIPTGSPPPTDAERVKGWWRISGD